MPGKIFLIDLHQEKILENDEIKLRYSSRHKYDAHLQKNQVFLKDLKTDKNSKLFTDDQFKRFQIFWFLKEDIKFFLNPIINSGAEPIGSMGTDTPISLLCSKSKLLYSYFKQCFAQVTNPPIDYQRRVGDVTRNVFRLKTKYFSKT